MLLYPEDVSVRVLSCQLARQGNNENKLGACGTEIETEALQG